MMPDCTPRDKLMSMPRSTSAPSAMFKFPWVSILTQAGARHQYSGGSPTPTSSRSVRTKPLIRGSLGSPPPPPPPPAHEGLLGRDNTHNVYSAAVLLGVLNNLNDLVGGWKTWPKVLYCGTMMVAGASMAVGIMAVTSTAPTPSSRRISSMCARLSSTLSNVVLVVAISCTMGGHGWVIGVASGAVTAGIMAAIWTRGEPAAAEAVSRFPGRVVKLWRRGQPGVTEGASLPYTPRVSVV